MSDNSKIEWTSSTWNPTTGCTKVSPGCANCYIAGTPPFRMAGRKFEKGHIPLILHENRLTAPLRWRKPRRIFVNSLSDLFHEDVPDEFIDRVFAVMALTPQHTYQVLTKRPDRMRKYLTSFADADLGLSRFAWISWLAQEEYTGYIDARPDLTWRWPLPNVWLGVTVENQHFADERIPLLLETPAAVRFLSCEPLLGAVSLPPYIPFVEGQGYRAARGALAPGRRERPDVDWVIAGGESGPGARPTDIEHIRAIVRQCRNAGVPVFVKQLGAKPRVPSNEPMYQWPESTDWDIVDNTLRPHIHLKDRKGGDMAEWPEDLRIRDFPAVRP